MKVLDTTFLIDLSRGNEDALKLIESKSPLLTTQINMYELMRGLFLRGMSLPKLREVMEVFEDLRVLSLDNNSIIKSAEISAELIKSGKEISDCDCLTAGIALSKGVDIVVTRNQEHFKRIRGIKVQNY
ncbi:PIN domain-containing protein [Candidatus Woesearchaeota archaeon]|nr:PIN domain-containing protein [Candidatus Woesearchaeota archaeon]